ncbi:hypothetical protein ACH4L9_12390 [Streptomyces globisporus]|uniref:hypothetical protein n=1 Tax=Streptomyces globisporus TaxID=1908 RepID=UPI0037AAA347
MDAGLAAVLGALAGAVGTTAAGMATGWASREQAKIAAKAEHRRQRREPRQVAYGDLLRSCAALRDHMTPMYGFPPDEVQVPRPDLDQEFVDRAHTLTLAIRECWLSVALAGPKLLAESAEATEYAASKLSGLCHVHHVVASSTVSTDPNLVLNSYRLAHGAFRELDERLSEFRSLAQAALDDDGTR